MRTALALLIAVAFLGPSAASAATLSVSAQVFSDCEAARAEGVLPEACLPSVEPHDRVSAEQERSASNAATSPSLDIRRESR